MLTCPFHVVAAKKERGDLLTIWLSLLLVANIVVVFLYLVLALSPFVKHGLPFPGLSLWTLYLFSVLGAFNAVCACFLLLWKKWAFFGLCESAAAALVLNLYGGVGLIAFEGLAGVAITFLVLRPKWNLFDNF